MKKKLMIELLIYAVLVVIGVIMMFAYQPEKKEIVIPRDFEIQWEGVVK